MSGERDRWLATRPALLRLRADLQAWGIRFSWETDEHRLAGGLIQPRLIGVLAGQVDNQARAATDQHGQPTMQSSQHTGYQAAAWAMSVISPFFRHACIVGGAVERDGSWRVRCWLNATELEALEFDRSAS